MIQKGERKSALALLSDTITTDNKDDLSSISAALTLHSVALCTEGSAQDKAKGLQEIQRAIMLRPSIKKSWQALGYIRSCASMS
jgi:superkiller protein 3